jgi:hypothetical protein
MEVRGPFRLGRYGARAGTVSGSVRALLYAASVVDGCFQ